MLPKLKLLFGFRLPRGTGAVNRKVRLVVWSAILILLSLMAVDILFSYYSTVRTVQNAIAQQGIGMARSIAESMDVPAYKRFLDHPGYGTDYWSIREQLNDTREKLGVLYVYTLRVDNPDVSYDMIVGFPPEAGEFPIGEACTVPAAQVRLAFEGEPYMTNILHDPKYGDYLSAGAPITDEQGKVIGYLGIDFSTDMLNDIKRGVIAKSYPIFLSPILFLVILWIAFSLIQRWYRKSARETVLETEQTYQREFQAFAASVKAFRHDFSNHLHVISGLLEIGQAEKARDYTRSLTGEIRRFDFAAKIRNPALLILLQSKWDMAQNLQVDLSMNIEPDPFDRMAATDLIKIVSNLLDNALEAASVMPHGERNVKVDCRRMNGRYVFEVINTGPAIQESAIPRLFESGYTTKPSSPGAVRGFGLSVVRKTADNYAGDVRVDTNGSLIRFRVSLPVWNETRRTEPN